MAWKRRCSPFMAVSLSLDILLGGFCPDDCLGCPWTNEARKEANASFYDEARAGVNRTQRRDLSILREWSNTPSSTLNLEVPHSTHDRNGSFATYQSAPNVRSNCWEKAMCTLSLRA